MLTVIKKALILAQAGITVPHCPDVDVPAPGRQPYEKSRVLSQPEDFEAEQILTRLRWNQEIEILFVVYTADRAAKSLRKAEQDRQIDILRKANIRPSPI